MEEVEIWLARDDYGDLIGWSKKPIKDKRNGVWNNLNDTDFFYLSEKLFPNVQWEDEEPTKAKIVLNK